MRRVGGGGYLAVSKLFCGMVLTKPSPDEPSPFFFIGGAVATAVAAAMGGKKPTAPKQTDEEKAEQKRIKACESMFKACKDDEVKKVQENLDKGADINWQNDKGHTAAHVCAAFGALDTLRLLHKQGANLELINEKKMTPLQAAKHIGEVDAAKLIEALLAGLSGDDIGKDNAESDDDDAELAKAKAAAASKASSKQPSKAAKSTDEVVDVTDAASKLEIADDASASAPGKKAAAAADAKKAASPAGNETAAPYPVAASA